MNALKSRSKSVLASIVIAVILASFMIGFYVAQSGYVGDLTEQWYTPSQEATYIVGQYNSTFYYLQNHTGYGHEAYDGYELESSNFGTIFQVAITNTDSGGSIYIKSGHYNINDQTITYERHRTIMLLGDGGGNDAKLDDGNTTLHFVNSNFNENTDGIWNNGYTYFVARNICFTFTGNATLQSTSNPYGLWSGNTTLPDFEDVSLRVTGGYVNSTGAVLFGRGVGGVGRTGVWRNVLVSAEMTSGWYVTLLRINFDTFIWDGGSIVTVLGANVYDLRLLRIEATMGCRVSTISSYRGDSRPISWFWLTPMNWASIAYEFQALALYGLSDGSDVINHFTSTEGIVAIRLQGIQPAGPLLKLSSVVSIDKNVYSYLVYTDGTNYYMQNGASTQIDFRSTNATAVITYALANVSANGGGTVFLKAGHYYPSKPIFIYNNTALIGESKDSVIIHNNRPYTAWGVEGEDRCGLIRNQHYVNDTDALGENQIRDQNMTIAHLTIEGNRTSTSGFGIAMGCVDNVLIEDVYLCNVESDTINFNGLHENQDGWGQGIGNATNIRIRNVVINNSGVDGLAFNNVHYFLISDYYCSYFGQQGSGSSNGHAITLAGDCDHGEIENVIGHNSTKVTSAGASGICLYGGHDVSFANIWIWDADGYGIRLEEAGANNPNNVQFVNTHIFNCSYDGFSLKNTYYVQVSNLEVMNSGYGNTSSVENNVDLFNSERSIFSNLMLRDNQATHTTWNAIYEEGTGAGACDSNMWCNIQIWGCRNATGIYLLGTNTLNSTIINNP